MAAITKPQKYFCGIRVSRLCSRGNLPSVIHETINIKTNLD